MSTQATSTSIVFPDNTQQMTAAFNAFSNQSWSAPSRSLNVTYYNNIPNGITGKILPIFVSITVTNTNDVNSTLFNFYINGSIVVANRTYLYSTSANPMLLFNMIVPPNASYLVTKQDTAFAVLQSWAELS